MYNFIDLFCGLGGFRIAFESADMKCVFSCDIDKHVREVYFQNFGEIPHGDITQIDSEDIPDHDVLCAGFPCQPFSLAGKRLGFEDTRGTLFFEVARIMSDKKPLFVLLENVSGLVNHDKGKTIKVIEETIKQLGYYFEYRTLNAYDYGVPQNRSRWYGVAIRCDIAKKMEEKGLSFKFPDKKELMIYLEDILELNNSDNEYLISDICKKNINIHLGNYMLSDRYDISHPLIATEIRPSRCNFRCDGISPCLTAKMGTGGNNVPVIVTQERKLTEKECLAIMGFPKNYLIKKNTQQSYKQIGNSVVVPIIEMFALEIRRILDEVM